MPKLFALSFSALLLLTSCMEDVKEKEGSLGTEAAPSAVQKALNAAFSQTSIINAKVNQTASYEDNLRVELGPVMRSRLIQHRVNNILETKTTIDYVIDEIYWKFDLNSGDIIDEKNSQFTLTLQKSTLETTKQSQLEIAGLPRTEAHLTSMSTAITDKEENECDGVDETDGEGHTYDCVKYFNLTSGNRLMNPPDAVTQRENCMGLPDCKLRIYYLQYDIVKWRKKTAVNRLTLRAEIALDVPDILYEPTEKGFNYTPAVLSLCYKGHSQINSKNYLVTQCTVLRDFQL